MNNNSLVPEATRRKMSESHKGMKMSPAHCANISKGLKGRIFSPEHRQKISEAQLEKYRNGWSPNKGRKHTPEQNAMISAMFKGRPMNEATKEKLRLSHLGKKWSPEFKEKWRQIRIGLNRKGADSPHWKGGSRYYFHKYARIIWEEHNGVKIPPGHHIHHIDGNYRNNNPENLQLLTPEEHLQLHPYDPACRDYKKKPRNNSTA